MWVKYRFLDGPCLGRNEPAVSLQAPPRTLACGKRTYVLFAETPAPARASYDTVASYAVSGGSYDHAPERIKGERDMFRAWSRLHHALNKTSRRELLKARRAGKRIRRAVR